MRAVVAAVALALVAVAAAAGWLWWRMHAPWKQWQAYAEHFVQDDGRVVDRTAGGRSTSEAQAYSLFFALVANDRPRFDRILAWTRDNLGEGDLSRRLPAWLWGEKPDGSWGVIDANPASDADLWLAYALLEAGRIWNDRALGELGRGVLSQVRAQELAQTGSAGVLLLPGPQGFRLDDGRWRLNPSYYPRFQFEYLATVDPSGPWREVWTNYQPVARQAFAAGRAPDWLTIDAQGRVQPDPQTGSVGSYDAIRVYLWAGISAGIDPAGLERLAPFVSALRQHGNPPEFVDSRTGAVWGGAPLGFSAAVLPFLKALGEYTEAKSQEQRLRENQVDGRLGKPAHYYDQVLALFGEGWASKRFRVQADGRLTLRWESLCCAF